MATPMSGAPAPVAVPKTHARPEVAPPPRVKRPRRPTGVIVLLAVVALAAAAAILWRTRTADRQTGPQLAVGIRTVQATSGGFDRVLRLTGSTGAERFVSLIAPQMRGSRTFQGGQGTGATRGSRGERSGGGGASLASTGGGGGGGGRDDSSSRGSNSSSGSSSTISSALTGGSAGSAGGSITSNSSAASSSSMGSGMSGGGSTTGRSSMSRVGERSRSASQGSGGRSSGGASSMGSSGLGTSAETLPGGGVPGGSNSGGGGGSPGGGGGGGDFGLVLQHLIKPGSLVKKGDLLAEFDRQYMMNRLDDYRAGVEQDERSLKRLKAELDVSRQAHAQSILSAKGAMEKADLDLKSLPVRSAIESERFRLAKEEAVARYKQLLSEVKFVQVSEKSQLRVQEIELEQAKVELKRAEANADRMVAKAPIDGLVVIQSTRRGTELGQFQQGDQVYPGQFYMQIVDTRSMVINAFVNQADSERIRIGARARVRFDAYPDLELPARVYSVGAMTKSGGMRASYMKELPVKVKLEKMDPRVIPDLSVSVDVIEETEQAAAIVPREAIFRDASDQAPHVYVRGEGGWERREIELGPVNHVAAIVRRGLNAGEVLAADRPYLPAKQN